ncbi:MAG: N-6 DNA methylase, partial [Candidatus Bathyarchaeia archaeon]
MTETWFKILEELESPYTGSQRLEDQLHALLIKGETYTLQKADQFKTEIEFLAKIIVAHQDYVLKHGFFSDMFGDYMEQDGKLNSGTGQFLTPTCITEMMAQIVFGNNDFERMQVFGDPASGTGRFMLQTAKLYAEKTGKLNFLYVNTDIDFRAYVYCVMNARS